MDLLTSAKRNCDESIKRLHRVLVIKLKVLTRSPSLPQSLTQAVHTVLQELLPYSTPEGSRQRAVVCVTPRRAPTGSHSTDFRISDLDAGPSKSEPCPARRLTMRRSRLIFWTLLRDHPDAKLCTILPSHCHLLSVLIHLPHPFFIPSLYCPSLL